MSLGIDVVIEDRRKVDFSKMPYEVLVQTLLSIKLLVSFVLLLHAVSEPTKIKKPPVAIALTARNIQCIGSASLTIDSM